MRKKILLSIAALLAVGAIAAYAMNQPEPADTRFSGVYELDDDSLVFITPREGSVLLTAKQLETPSLWLLAGNDSSAPTPWTVAELRKLQSQGSPVQFVVYPDVEHGIVRYTEDESGERRYIGYAPEYCPRQMEWLREQSSL